MNEHGKKETTRWEAQPMPDRRQGGNEGEEDAARVAGVLMALELCTCE